MLFRSVRKTRSLLSRLRGVYDAEAVRPFRDEFGWLGALTGPTRDLDVYLLKFDDYKAGLPRSEHVALNDLHHFLRRQQKREQAKLKQGGPESAAEVYAESGIWYDAIDELSKQIAAKPALRGQRAALLEQVGLNDVAAFDRGS